MTETIEKQDSPTIKITSIILDNDKNTKLHYSAALGKTDEVSKELIGKEKIDVENYLGWTPLMMASKNGHKDMVKLLLELGADPSRKNKFGMSVFLISISNGNLELVRLLLQHLLCGGISKRSLQVIFSPLSIAILFHQRDILQYLISQNFNINAATPYTGITPLMFASAMEDDEAFTILLKGGADVTFKNHTGITAHDIKKLKCRIEEKRLPKPLTPAELISKSPHMGPFRNSPYLVISPQPSFFHLSPNQIAPVHLQKSSNTMTPSPNCYIASPHLTPIGAMALVPQMFFSSEFPAGQMFTPSPCSFVNSYNGSNEFLNAKLNASNMFLSPAAHTNFLSPCV